MEILDVKNLDLIKSIHYKEELHPRDTQGRFAQKHGIVSEGAAAKPKKPAKAAQKVKPKATTARKDSKAKTTPKKTAPKKSEAPVKGTTAKKPAAKKTAKTKEAAPKMPPVVDNPVKKRAPRAAKSKVVDFPGLPKPQGELTSDFQAHGRVRVVARRTGDYAVPSMKINSYEDVAQVFADLADSDREKSYVLALKNKKIVGIHCAHIGNINSSIMDVKDMMKIPLLTKADTVYLIHNHPSGQSGQSPEDMQVTKRFSSVAWNMQVNLAGHVIIGDNEMTFLDRNGDQAGYNSDIKRDDSKRKESAPVYETYQERKKDMSISTFSQPSDVIDYIKSNLSLDDSSKGIFIIGTDTKNQITHAEPIDVTLPANELRKKALESLILANSKNFFMYTGNANMDTLINAGIKKAAQEVGMQLYDVIRPNTSDREDLNSGNFHFKSMAEQGLMDVVKSLYIDLQKAIGSVTRADAKAIHKDLPPGGQWRTMNGHHIYIKDGKVLAGAVPGTKGAKKATKAHLSAHQETIDKETKEAKKKAKKPAAKKSDPTKEARKKIEDTLKGANNKENSTPRKKITKEFMAEQKKKVDAATKKPKAKGKKPTLEEQQAEAKKILEEEPVKKTRKKGTSEGKKVADIRTEKQTGHEVAYDVGEKIGGARKDLAISGFTTKATGQSLEELEAVSPEMAQKLCIKKNLLAPIDFESEFKRGTDINVAMAKQLIYDRIIPKPSKDTPEERKMYLNAIQSIQRSLEPIKSWDEFKKAVKDLGYWMKRETPKNLADQERYLAYAEKEAQKEPTSTSLQKWDSKASDWKTITKEQWQEEKNQRVYDIKSEILLAKQAAKAPYAPLGVKLTNFFTNYESRDRTLDTVAKKGLKWDTYFKQKPVEKVKKGEKTKEKWERVMPAIITRSGGRATPVKKPEDMVKTFNLRGIEFGNWVDDKSGNFHLVKCAESFHDMADILGLKDKDISLNGKLAMAFGARGMGGYLAHYEPSNKAINITKEGGAGSLAHEWGHALDNILYQASAGRNSMNYASEGLEDQGSLEVKSSYKKLMDAIMVGDGSGVDMVPYKGLRGYSYHKSFQQAVQVYGMEEATKKVYKAMQEAHVASVSRYIDSYKHYRYSEADIQKKIDSLNRKHKQAVNVMVQEMGYHHEKLTGSAPTHVPLPTGKSNYYVDSSTQGGAGNKYWTSEREMFARAFENYIEGKMRSGKVKNDYLVHGTWVKAPVQTGFIRAPYPAGTERDNIHDCFDELIAAVRKSGEIQKGLSFDLQKSYRYFDSSDVKAHSTAEFYRLLKEELAKDETKRSAYNVASTEGVLYIPINRLQTPYQTEKATNFDKIRENVTRMENGENLEPVVIGFNYEVHDGHHKLESSKIRNYTHVPCVIGEFNDIDKQRLYEEYSALWKSLESDIKDTDLAGEKKAILGYSERLKEIKDPKVRKVIAEIIADEKNHEHNLKKVLAYLKGDKNALDELQKSILPMYVDPEAFPFESTGYMFRGIGQKEFDFILRTGFIQSKGKGNDEDQESITCFSQLFSQAEGYARSNYDLYNEKQAYVLAVDPMGVENELGEIEVRGKIPESAIKAIIPIGKTPIVKGLYIDLQKGITRADAKKLHKDLPEGGQWRTMNGHHIYIKDGKVLAGAIPGVKGAKKATKAHLAEHQAKISSVHKSEKPMYSKGKGAGNTIKASKTKGVDAKMETTKLPKKLSATNAKKFMGEQGIPAGHREALLQILEHKTTVNHFRPGEDGLEVQGSKEVVGREYSTADVQKAISKYKTNKKFAKDIADRSTSINEAIRALKMPRKAEEEARENETANMLKRAQEQRDEEATGKAAMDEYNRRHPNQAPEDFDPFELMMIGTELDEGAKEEKTNKPKKTQPEPVATPYHIVVPKGKNGKAKYVPVHEHAEKVRVGGGVHAFVHGKEGDWSVSEARSGLKITSNSSKSMAVKHAKQIVEQRKDELNALIKKHIETHGESPKTRPTFEAYVEKEVGGSTHHLSVESWNSYRRSYDYLYMGKR